VTDYDYVSGLSRVTFSVVSKPFFQAGKLAVQIVVLSTALLFGMPALAQSTGPKEGDILAAPLVIDLARLGLLAQRRGEAGILRHLACFFKSPMGVEEHDFFRQFRMLEAYAGQARQDVAAGKS